MQLCRPLTEELYLASTKLMPGGVNSPVRAFRHLEMTPLMVRSGKGDTIWDVDGHSYLDFCQSWGALILGHAPERVIRAVTEQLQHGTSYGIGTPYEKALAEKVQRHVPSMEMLRFVSSGTEAVMSAVRLARGYTGKSVLIKFNGHFHGHSDSLLIQAGSGVTHLPQASSQGIPKELAHHTLSLPFNDFETCQKVIREREDIAAIIVEPISGNMGVVPPKQGFLEMLRDESRKKGILLIFDEVITGFRVGIGGAQKLYGIDPDLTCLGKVIGGGFPVAAFGGKRKILEQIAPLGGVYQAGTLSGNPIAMCAGLETLNAIEEPLFYEKLQEKTERFLHPIREKADSLDFPIAIQSIGSMFTIFFGVEKVESKEDLGALDEKLFAEFFKFLFHRGIYLSPSAHEAHFLSAAHTEAHLGEAQSHILDFLGKL
ncbi:MAG: glutamate-1-semialdehyde 2,1-aminomutase [Verrucomicrobia bacterium]|nr:glutamate-1-semialdehyde 2,1-aminomutase [Verrucomicrobiota bacterium]